MFSGLNSLWFIMTVIIPGMAFYGTLRVLLGLFDFTATFLDAFDKSETLTISLVIACGILLQVLGIIVECITFKFGPYRHAKAGLTEEWENMEPSQKKENENVGKQYVWDRRYYVISMMNEGNDSEVERILAQFFMSHNISIAMVIHSIWVIVCVVRLGGVITFGHQITSVIVIILTLLSFYIPYNRFKQSSDVLFEFYLKNEEEDITL